MGKCRVCGRWAGFFSDEHPECAERAKEEAKRAQEQAEKEKVTTAKAAEVQALIKSAPEGAVAIEELVPLIAKVADGNSDITWRGYCDWITALASARQLPTHKEEEFAVGLLERYSFDKDQIPDGGWDKLGRLCTMRDLEEGTLPTRVSIAGSLPFNLELGERIVWVFQDTQYLEDKVTRSSARSYGGLSVRVAPGVYLHGGQSAPSISSEGFVAADTGMLALSDRAVLFQGQHRALRFKYKDIASFTKYDFGFAICKGTQTARQIGFLTKDVFPGFPDILLRGLCNIYMQTRSNSCSTANQKAGRGHELDVNRVRDLPPIYPSLELRLVHSFSFVRCLFAASAGIRTCQVALPATYAVPASYKCS